MTGVCIQVGNGQSFTRKWVGFQTTFSDGTFGVIAPSTLVISSRTEAGVDETAKMYGVAAATQLKVTGSGLSSPLVGTFTAVGGLCGVTQARNPNNVWSVTANVAVATQAADALTLDNTYTLQMTAAPTATTSKSHTWLIVGIVVGVIVLLLVIGVILFFVLRRKPPVMMSSASIVH